MTTDALLVLEMLFELIWSLFTSWYIPGTRVTPAAWAFFMLGCVLVFKILKRVFSMDEDDV